MTKLSLYLFINRIDCQSALRIDSRITYVHSFTTGSGVAKLKRESKMIWKKRSTPAN
jgi:hypothetical protein